MRNALLRSTPVKTKSGPLRALVGMAGRMAGFVVGNVKWSAPPWFEWIIGRARALSRNMAAHPRAWAATLVVLAAIAGSGWLGWKWWEAHRPRVVAYHESQKVKVTWKEPGILPATVLEKDLKPVPFLISFSLPVAPMEKVGKGPGAGITMEPKVNGAWKWQDSRTLMFEPGALHWSPGTKYRVKIAASEISPLMELDHQEIEFTTPLFAAELRDFAFYTNPEEPSVHQVVGELRLSHPATLEEIQRQIRLEVIGGTALFAPAPEGTLPVTVNEGKTPRQFFLRSRNLAIPEKEDFVKLRVLAGLQSSVGGAPLAADVGTKTRVPDKFSGFELTGVSTNILRTDDGEPQQFLFVDSDKDLDGAEIASHISAWWSEHEWPMDDKTKLEAAIAAARKIELLSVESAAPLSRKHAFRFTEPRSGALLVRVEHGVKAPGGFELGKRFQDLADVPEFPKEVQILGKGNVLALNGARKIIAQSRGIDHLQLTIGRVPVSQIQHLITQNRYGSFQEPELGYRMDENNLVQRWHKIVEVPRENDWDAKQTVFDLTEIPAMTSPDVLEGGRGIFFAKIQPVKKRENKTPDATVYGRIDTPDDDAVEERSSWYEESEERSMAEGWMRDEGNGSQRFVMITDLGLLLKVSASGGRDVFVMSLSKGQPEEGVVTKVLARNGTVLAEAVTGADGKAVIPSLEGYADERQPVAILAQKAADVSFLPLRERALPAMDYSRFDIEGVMASRQKAVEGFLFTERGIYRPGDDVHIGVMVRRRDWQPVLEGLPVRVRMIDAQGKSVGEQRVRLSYDGFFEVKFPLTSMASLGQYAISAAVLNSRDEEMFRLGRTSVRVEEFQPDRMKVVTAIDPAAHGWRLPEAAMAKVSVQSLFGDAASERRVTMRLVYSPIGFSFDQWDGYTFYDRYASESSSKAGREVDLGEKKTNEQGLVEFKLPFENVRDASYQVSVLTEAFEREGGRSVRHVTTQLVSPLEQVVGWKADGDLDYIGKDAVRTLTMVALNRSLKSVAMEALQRRLIEIRNVSVLTKLDNGNYAYVSTPREKVVDVVELSLTGGENSLALSTGKTGAFRMEIVDSSQKVICAVPYRVAGKGDESRTLDQESELELVLAKGEANPGEEIEITLNAPYSGAGVVTLERDHVLTHQWFHTETNSTTVRMRVPEDAEGTVYVNATFVRSVSSPEIFRSPLSYAAAPLLVAPLRRQIEVKLDVPELIRPGTEARFAFTSSKPSRIVVFAVDEGIHQITNFKLPRPLDYFTRKQALEVRSLQWLDLLMPEYQFLRAAPAFGGDADGALSMHINPFKRRQEAPVVYWSGIVQAGTEAREVTWRVPDYFNGNLRVMAVAVREDGVGVAEKATLVKAPIIMIPNVPLFASPGDEFEASIAVTNNLSSDGDSLIRIHAVPSAHLELLGSPDSSLELPRGKEGVMRFRFRAKEELGGAEVKFTATGGVETVNRSTTLSVRPATHHLTKVTSGWFRTGSYDVKTSRVLYPQFRRVEATGSILPLGLARGLEAYVSEYPHGCSEQITSRAMVKLLVSTEADFGLSREEAGKQIRSAIALLANRQQSDGGFGYWSAGSPRAFEFHSLYVLHFLTEAKAGGYAVPEEMMKGALSYAARTARASIQSLREADLQAYAIYLMARNGENPSPQLLNLRDTLTKRYAGNWEGTSTAGWMAGTYRLLKQEKEGAKVMSSCLEERRKKVIPAADAWSYYDRTPDAEALKIFYLRCRHFPEDAKNFGYDDLAPVMEPLSRENFTTLTSSFMTLALKAYSETAAKTGIELSLVSTTGKGGDEVKLAGPGKGILQARLPEGTSSVGFRRHQEGSGDIGAFFQIVEQGYDKLAANGAQTSGLGILRSIKPVKDGRQPVRPGDAIDVTLTVRNLTARDLRNIAVVDLLPAGFEVVAGELKSGSGTVPGTEFAELREDRNLFYLGLPGNGEWSVRYRMKAVCPGKFGIPAAMVEDMYDRGRHGVSKPDQIEVIPAL